MQSITFLFADLASSQRAADRNQNEGDAVPGFSDRSRSRCLSEGLLFSFKTLRERIYWFLVLQNDVKCAVQTRMIDNSSSVREAALDLIGRYIMAKPELIEQYYKMISDRILVKLCALATTSGFHLLPLSISGYGC